MSERSLLVLIEGRPAVGKMTVARRLGALLREADVPLAGFVTQELREGGRRVGFAIGTFDGAHGVLGYVQRTCFAWISRQIAVTPDRRRMVAKGSVLTAKPR